MTDEDRIRDVYRAYESSGRSRLWDLGNPGYARLQHDRDARIMETLGLSIPPGPASLLDVGCGDGSLLASIHGQWPDVRLAGIDLQPERVKEARDNVPDANLMVGSADALPCETNSFDVVCAITIMSSIPSRNMEIGAAREIERVVRPGGWLVWYDLRFDNPFNPSVHGITKARLAELFPGWRSEVGSLTVAPPIARRLGPLTPVAYPLLHAIAPLRSHLVGRLLAPPAP